MKTFFFRSPSVCIILIAFISVAWVNFNLVKWDGKRVIKWDIVNYYSYLPAFFIEKDLSLGFIEENKEAYASASWYVPEYTPNGKPVIKSAMGMSLMYMPFFLMAHAYAHLSGTATHGFSEPYHFAVIFSGLFYLMLGLFYLRKLLLIHFTESVTAITLACVVFGTHLFYYASVDGAMPHASSFALITMFVYYSLKWKENNTVRISLMLGVVAGLIILVRPVNMLVLVFFLFINYRSLVTRPFPIKPLLVMVFTSFLLLIPQLLYWKTVTGHYLFFSYVGEKFYFDQPHLLEGLFGFRKGWLVYTPMMLFALTGFIPLYKKRKEFFIPVLSILLVYLYVVLSWWCWWYGGSYGLRAMIDLYPLLALPLAAFINEVALSAKFKKIAGYSVLSILILFSILQTLQFKWGIIHYDSMTKEAYVDALFRINPNPNQKNLIDPPDYEKALKGEQ